VLLLLLQLLRRRLLLPMPEQLGVALLVLLHPHQLLL
jgi:hypothetical protein